ncbi:MAG: glycosyltransferase family 4 protein [Lentisphaeria bacterium]|nr:glycosyltransferase family 4 protein [Lentisphaeria bacterium]
MRLLLFTERFRIVGAGAENDAVSLCEELGRRKHEVHVCADEVDEQEHVQVHQGLETAAALERRLKPDLTIDWGFYRAADVHRVGGGVHREFLKYALMSAPPWLRWYKRLEHRFKKKHRSEIRSEEEILRNPRALYLPISNFIAEQLSRAGIPDERVQVLYNSVDTERFAPDQDVTTRNELRQQWNVPVDGTVLLFVASDLRLKNAALLHRVCTRLHQEDAGMRLVVVGKRPPRFHAPWLVWQPTMHDVERAYAAADILVHPTFYDSFANVVLEAMSCGKPVLVSDRAGVAEIVRAEGGGLVLDVVSPDADEHWGREITALARDPDLRERFGAKGRRAAGNHPFADYVSQIEGVLQSCAAACVSRKLGEMP